MLNAEQVRTIFESLTAAYDAFAARHGAAYVKTSAMVGEIVDDATAKLDGAFTREQVLEAWTCVLVADALAASGAVPRHEQN